MSRLELDICKRKTVQALAAPNLFHGALGQAFPDDARHCLWRVDTLHGRRYLMILSKVRPDLTEVVLQFGNEESVWETKDYEPLLSRIKNGSSWHFRLVANPTHSVGTKVQGERKRGKVFAHHTPEHQLKWLLDKADTNGFIIENEQCDVRDRHWYSFRKNSGSRHQVSIMGVTFEGILTVNDELKFKDALCKGIGRGKAYGMGLLTVVSI
ncbi:MAG: type I-E CRISPR-associated protein Cas6/Cse3/CasE [Lachnospiraceae bacterium]|nr:type I-E CRISPR-associated protein Cas6/Cse3/CasE [Lachnospiraceae bacterium]